MSKIKAFILAIVFVISAKADLNNQAIKRQNPSEDIHVEAFVRGRRILQLNVTLLKPVESPYDVTISTVPSNTTNHCTILKHCVVHGIPESQQSITFPENAQFVTEYENCNFQNDCTYNVSAKAMNGKASFSTFYHVKECVNGLCLCRHAERLPKPLIFPSLLANPKRLFFHWEIGNNGNISEANDASLQYLTIDIDELRDCNLSWSGNGKSLASFHEKLNNFGVEVRKNDFTKELTNVTDVKCLIIRMSVVDSQNCKGPQVNVTVQVPSDIHHTDMTFQVILISIAGAITTLATIMMVIYVFLWKNRKKNIVNYWRGLYHNVQNGGNQMIPMRENILYFEKDSDEDWFEIPHSYIREIGREIGKGAFGRVFIARISDIPGRVNGQIVAIKKLKKGPTTDQLEEFLQEISTMKRVGKHQNIVRLLGFCTLEQPLMMIMEFVPCGDLLKYLRTVRAKHESTMPKTSVNSNLSSNNDSLKHSTSNHSQILGPLGKYLDILHSHSTSSASETSSYITQPDGHPSTHQNNISGPCTSRPSFAETMYTNLTVPSNLELSSMISTNLEYVVDHKELHNFAIQIARGMKHLQDLQITHRDLAARNILIDENKTLKISDFGLSRSGIYVNTKNKKVPLRWLSIEAMKDNLYSSKSDVWAFAIVLWEIGTLGGFPYPTVSNHELLNFLKSGSRLDRPENCSETLYELMLQCWTTDPDDRPDFHMISSKLDPNRNMIYIDFGELSPNYVFPPTSEDFTIKNVVDKLSKV